MVLCLKQNTQLLLRKIYIVGLGTQTLSVIGIGAISVLSVSRT